MVKLKLFKGQFKIEFFLFGDSEHILLIQKKLKSWQK